VKYCFGIRHVISTWKYLLQLSLINSPYNDDWRFKSIVFHLDIRPVWCWCLRPVSGDNNFLKCLRRRIYWSVNIFRNSRSAQENWILDIIFSTVLSINNNAPFVFSPTGSNIVDTYENEYNDYQQYHNNNPEPVLFISTNTRRHICAITDACGLVVLAVTMFIFLAYTCSANDQWCSFVFGIVKIAREYIFYCCILTESNSN
jgi:hypothetical protein